MLRVLQVVTYMGRGGLETMLMNYYRSIDRTKIQFDFLVHRDFRADYDDEIELLGGKIYRLPVLNPFSMHYRNELNRFFDEHQEYKIIHVHQDCLSSVILKVAKKHGVPVRIAHSHNSSQNKNLRYLIKIYYRGLIPKYATDLMACSREAGNWMFGKSSYKVLCNAIDVKRYMYSMELRRKIRQELGIYENEILVGHVGNFSRQKNHSYLIDIFVQIEQKTDAKLLLVGGQNLKPDSIDIMDTIKNKVKELKLMNRVIFAGTRSDVNELMQAMDVFVFPSNYEGLPVTIIEAQSAGLPCLISDNVPIECKKTDLVQQIPLSAGAETWAEAAITVARNCIRYDTSDQIRNAGYDITENAKWLEMFYLSSM